VTAKAEHLEKGENPRFVVTSLSGKYWPVQPLYEQPYRARGDMENRIKEQLTLFSDRTSTHYLRSNQLRLYFSFDRLRAVADATTIGTRGDGVGQGPVLHHSAQVAEDRRADPHHGTQGVGFAIRWVTLCRAVPADL
jgi:Transposase DDE domain group 1